jgi:integrase
MAVSPHQDRPRHEDTGAFEAPFFVRPFLNGKQVWHTLSAETFDQAKTEAGQVDLALDAQSKGLSVKLESLTNIGRIPIKTAVDHFLSKKSRKKPNTYKSYLLHLNTFLESTRVRFLDDVTNKTVERFADSLTADGYSARTQHNMMLTVLSMLKANKWKTEFSLKGDLPAFEDEDAVPYTQEELKKLFAHATEEETDRYMFFLGTGCREKEVQFAAWKDINFETKMFEVRRKEDVNFTPKSHESRSIPLPDSLVARVKARRARATHDRWIFVNEEGRPDGHFLRKLKTLALKAGINCGHCKTTVTKGRYEGKHQVEVTCKTDPVCEHIYLHRFRKTCATRWSENGISVFAMQEWLGHKDPNTTRRYVSKANPAKLRGNINAAFGD